MILIDTDIPFAFLRGNRTVAERMRASVDDAAMSAVTVAELLFGAKCSARPVENLAKLAELFGLLPAIPFDHECAAACEDVENHLRVIGKPIGEINLLIAARALKNGRTLVTHNKRHFENIPNLSADDWLVEAK